MFPPPFYLPSGRVVVEVPKPQSTASLLNPLYFRFF